MNETVKAIIAMLHGAGALMLLCGLLRAVRLGIVDGTAAAQTAAARTALGTLNLLMFATFLQATAGQDSTAWMQFAMIAMTRIGSHRLFTGDRQRLE